MCHVHLAHRCSPSRGSDSTAAASSRRAYVYRHSLCIHMRPICAHICRTSASHSCACMGAHTCIHVHTGARAAAHVSRLLSDRSQSQLRRTPASGLTERACTRICRVLAVARRLCVCCMWAGGPRGLCVYAARYSAGDGKWEDEGRRRYACPSMSMRAGTHHAALGPLPSGERARAALTFRRSRVALAA